MDTKEYASGVPLLGSVYFRNVTTLHVRLFESQSSHCKCEFQRANLAVLFGPNRDCF